MTAPARSQFVADTHALLWWLIDAGRLSPAANAAFQLVEADLADLWLPTIVLVELVSLARKRQLPLQLGAILEPRRLGSAARVADLTVEVVREFETLDAPSEVHDRLIVATARVLDAALITADHEIRASGQVDTIW